MKRIFIYLTAFFPGILHAQDTTSIDFNKLPITVYFENSYLTKIALSSKLGELRPGDQLFLAAYKHPQKIDSALGKTVARNWVNDAISRYEIRPLISENGALKANPEWDDIAQLIRSKYPLLEDPAKFLDEEKLKYYRETENWKKFATLKSAMIKSDQKKTTEINAFWGLNAPAWDVFQNSTDEFALKHALTWSELSIEISKPEDAVQFWDTKANLLYKLGRKKDAISTEQKAIEVATKYAPKDEHGTPYFVKEYKELLEKMKNGVKTW